MLGFIQSTDVFTVKRKITWNDILFEFSLPFCFSGMKDRDTLFPASQQHVRLHEASEERQEEGEECLPWTWGQSTARCHGPHAWRSSGSRSWSPPSGHRENKVTPVRKKINTMKLFMFLCLIRDSSNMLESTNINKYLYSVVNVLNLHQLWTESWLYYKYKKLQYKNSGLETRGCFTRNTF